MPSETVLDMVFTAFLGGGLGALVWVRMSRLEARQDEIQKDLAGFREQMATGFGLVAATREDVARVHDEMGEMRGEMAIMRSDLTHVALAVGANRPKPAEGETSAN